MVIGKLTDPRTINYVPPNQRTTQYERLKDLDAPFPGDPASNEFGFWFNYFWEEARQAPNLTQAQKVKLSEVYFSVFQDAPNAGQIRPDFAAKDSYFKENALRQLLLIGFKRVAVERPKLVPRLPGGRVIAPAPLTAVDAAELMLTYTVEGNGKQWPILFRSDLRSYDEVKAHGGFTARARSFSSPIYKIYGLDKPWHPFNNPVYGASLWLRLGTKNKDNCLHTVISTGPSFVKITHFPILNDYNNFAAKSASGQYLCFKPFEEWTQADIQLAASDRQKVQAVKDSTGAIDYIQKENHIHVFHAAGLKGFNTEGYFPGKDKFPERGMEQIPVSHLLADLAFLQKYWYCHADGKIQLFEIKFAPIRWVPSDQVVDFLLGESGRLRLEAIIQEQVAGSENREDVRVEKRKRDTYRAETLTAQELAQVVARLKEYYLANPLAKTKPNGTAEKNAVIVKLPLLKLKIERTTVQAWSTIRTDAKK
jgi:hypothetical protein